MKSLRRCSLFALVLMLLVFLPVVSARAEIKVLSVPGFPFFLVMDLRYGNEIRDLVLRTPEGTKSLDSFKGLVYMEETPMLTYTDNDWRKDLLWKVHFSEPSRSDETFRGRDLWIAALTGVERIWIGSAETGPSIWDAALRQVEAPDGTAYLVSPRTRSDATCTGIRPENRLRLVYTIRLTGEGPRFVIVPQVYRQLADIADRVRLGERDPILRASYDNVCGDFKAMSDGRLPSTEALAAFPWKPIDNACMRP